jgi:hypothetical protein
VKYTHHNDLFVAQWFNLELCRAAENTVWTITPFEVIAVEFFK